MNKGLLTVLAIILVLAIAGASFYGGMVYGKSQAQSNVLAARAAFQGNGSFQGQGGAAANGTPGAFTRRSGQNGNFVLGTIKQIGDGTLTLTDNNGKETQVKVTDTTLIEKNQSVKLNDLTEGETVMVSGSTAADGTVTARSVQVAPQGRFGFGGGPGGPGDQAQPGNQGQPPAPGAAPQATPSN
jgi:hypothetical protein